MLIVDDGIEVCRRNAFRPSNDCMRGRSVFKNSMLEQSIGEQ